MKEFFEKIWDMVYDYLDYIVMLAIVLIVVGIIGWRLDIIFTDDVIASSEPPARIVEENNDDEDSKDVGQAQDQPDETDEPDDPVETDETDESGDESEDEPEDENEEEPEDTEVEDVSDVKIEIPGGTMSNGIADILLENRLIDDTSDFLERANELNIATGLKAGDYTIPSNSTIDEILEILSR